MKPGRAVAFAALAALSLVPCGARGGLRAQVFVGPRATAIPITNPLDTVTVPIVADVTGAGGAALGAITAQLSWRAGTLRFLGAGAGAAGVPVLNVDSANGTVRFALATAGGVSGLPVLMQARFQAIGPLGDSTTLAVTVSELTAAGTFAALTPATTAALVCVGAVAGRWGDLTGDDQVMSNDALAIVTHAVGLPIAPLTPINGDVDGDGAVHTRDALIVLSFVVGLPVPGFRVNQLRPSACGTGSPVAGVAVTPGTASLVTGDQLPLAVTVLDTGGAIVHANPAWLTRDAAVATVDRAGVVQAVGAGTTRIVVAAVPGIMDSTTVTVGGTRRVWYADAGASGAVQNGSPQFPFATLQDAVNAAAPDDTIRVAVGTYGTGLHLTGPMVVLGDSNALGFPTILPADTTPGVTIDNLGSGDAVTIRRLRVTDADMGVRAEGAGGVLTLDRVIVERSRGEGIRVTALDTARLDHVAVLGAVGAGIAADGLRLLWMAAVTSDGVSAGASGSSFSLKARQLDSLLGDSVDLRSATVLLDTAATVTLSRSFVGFANGPLFSLRETSDASFDSVTFRFARQGLLGPPAVGLVLTTGATASFNAVTVEATEGVGLFVQGRGAVTARDLFVRGPNQAPAPAALPVHAAQFLFTTAVMIAQSQLEGGTVEITDTMLVPAATARLDTVTFMDANLFVQKHARLDMRQVDMHRAAYTTLRVDNTPVVHLAGVEVEGNAYQPGFQSVGPFAIDFLNVDSVRADSLGVHDNHHGALRTQAVRVLTSYGSRFERNNAQSSAGTPITIYLNGLQSGRVAQAIIDERAGASFRYSIYWATSVSPRGLVVDTTTFLSPYLGVFATGTAGLVDTLVVRGSAFRLAGGYVAGRAAQASSVDHTAYLNNVVDSLLGNIQLHANFGISAEARGNVLNEVEYGIELSTAPGGSDFVGNQVSCVYPATYGSALRSLARPDSVVGNTITGCRQAVELFNPSLAAIGPSVLRNNTIVSDTIPSVGIEIEGHWRNLEIVGNDLGGPGRFGSAAINLDAQFGSYDIDSARIDSNLVHDGFGRAIRTTFGTRRFRMRGNAIDRMGQLSASDAAIMVDGGAVSDTNRITDNQVRQNRTLGIYLNTSAPTRVDSNVVVDDSTTALFVQTAGNVVGTRNFLARNKVGIQNSGTITIDQSVIQQHDTVGARGGGSMALANNWWGDATGPRCGASCPGALGDSVTAVVNFTPFLTSPPSTPTGAPPLRPVAGSRAAPAGASAVAGATRVVPASPRRRTRGRFAGAAAATVRLPTGEARRLTEDRP